MFYSHKAYLNAPEGSAVLVLTHDVKRALSDSKASKGHVHITSTSGTTGIKLIENDSHLQKGYLTRIEKTFLDQPDNIVTRRSGTGPDKYHHMAVSCGLTLTLPFENGRLLSSPFHEVVALDFEPKAGRREFIITIAADDAPAGAGRGQPMPRM
ncbi:MAG: hypothetical protein ACD_62C00148G0005 [uncultured bacterium]|nr:MAG: hypothetical protein ACD_62C00148G0005 [uncultured bacterium]HLD45366.1 YjbQ family protein [bacterium]